MHALLLNYLASLGRFERPTLCSASKCSDPLSYRDVRAHDFTTISYFNKDSAVR